MLTSWAVAFLKVSARYLSLKSTHSWKTLTLPKHLDRMGYRLQSSRTVPPSSPGRLRHSSIPWSKLGTFLNSSRRPSKLPYSRVGISMLLQTTGRYPCCLSYAKSWKKLSPLSWRAIRKSTAFFLLNSLLIGDRHSTGDALVYTVNKLLHARDVGKTTGLVFADLSKAFDRVQHQTLINELADIRLTDKALQWFISYLSDRSQQVRVAGSLNEETTCSRGVPQGSVLGPLLFTLYIRALPKIARVPCLMFADDILLCSSSADPRTSSNDRNWLMPLPTCTTG